MILCEYIKIGQYMSWIATAVFKYNIMFSYLFLVILFKYIRIHHLSLVNVFKNVIGIMQSIHFEM